jgi:ubiquinone/menaquinone biosynthesis C-methylase UbiE
MSTSLSFAGGLPEMYERFLVEPIFRPWAAILLGRIALKGHERLLDVACGTGIVARVAKSHLRLGTVVGVDASAQMLAIARRAAPDIEFREGPAETLPVPAGEAFDVVTCHQGLQFFPNKPGAVSEMRRVLAPGGRVGIGVWSGVDKLPLMLDLQRVAERHLGPIVDVRHNFGDPAALESLLKDGGFSSVRVETLSHVVRFEDATVFPRLNAMALVGMTAKGKAMTDEDKARTAETIANESADAIRRYSDGVSLTFDLASNIATATA